MRGCLSRMVEYFVRGKRKDMSNIDVQTSGYKDGGDKQPFHGAIVYVLDTMRDNKNLKKLEVRVTI
ncbi:hypothetical protein CMI38_02025 [Candidatus Pacearchaeota archaeon]|nr:hypothetical protein [Candidatus Pacearchaeota archaeon]